MSTIVNATIATFLFCACAALMAASNTTRRLITVKGRIVAFRPFDRAVQAPSFIPNAEVFLLQLDGPKYGGKPRIIKIDYRHFEFSDITPELLARNPQLRMRVMRDRTCDESYGHLVSTAPVIELSHDISGPPESLVEPIKFIGGFNGGDLSPSLKLECYALQKGNFQVV
jgi:hypothetical protein